MSNQWCDTCGGLVDRIGLRPQGVRFCECRETIEKLRAKLAAMTAERDSFKADSELLCRIVDAQFIDGLGGVDLHEEADIAAAENGREEPNTRDYIAAWRVAMEAER